jgi:uncharacterized membrane protein
MSKSMIDFHSMLESWNSPPTRHAMFVHMPIALAMIGAVLALLAAVLSKNATLRALAIGVQVALALAAFFTLNTGEAAEHAISVPLSQEVSDLIHHHEELAEKIWWFGLGVAGLLTLAAVTRGALRTILAWAAVLGSLATIGWVSVTAHHGGELVYKHGVGTRPLEAVASSAPRTTRPDRDASQAAVDRDDDQDGDRATSDHISPADDARVTFFREQVLPLLSRHCFNCHNPTRAAAAKSGSLDQTSRETLLAGGRSGPAIIPGQPEESLLLRRLRGDDPDEDIMPPRGKLPDESIAIIEQWIRDGAVWAEPQASE